MSFIKICILAVVQGAAELLPVSSSAHVIVAEKLMGLDPTAPEMTLLLVMLHTGTMFAVIFFFYDSWKESFFASKPVFISSARQIVIATAATGVVGLALKFVIEKIFLAGRPHAEIENIFGNLALMSAALAAAGVLIIYSGLKVRRSASKDDLLGTRSSFLIGAVQGVCLPFRGFSRSGATISTGLLLSVAKARAEEFSFALAVVLTPPVIVREALRLIKAQKAAVIDVSTMAGLFLPGLLGMALSFASGLLALRWLSSWLQNGRWHLFGFYCLFASALVFALYLGGY